MKNLWLLLSSVALGHASSPTDWTARGIGAGGGMFAPSYSPHDHNTIFLAVDMSNALRTTDGGTSWTTIDFTQLQVKQNSVVQFTSTPGVLYAQDIRRTATETTTVRPVKSRDNGNTWLPFANWSSSLRAQSVHASPLRSDTFLVCTGSHLRFYRDSGIVNVPDSDLDGTFAIAHTFSTAQTRVAGVFWHTGAQEECWVATNDGFLHSTDGGQSFTTSISPPTSNPIASFAGGRDPSTGQIRLYAITTSTTLNGQSTTQSYSNGTNRIWQLDWGNANWVEVTGTLTGSEHPTIVAMSSNNINIAYVATNRTGNYPNNCAVWRITSPGSAWTNIFLTAGNSNIETGWGSFNSRAMSGARQLETAITYATPGGLAVHPNQPDRLVFCDNAVIHQSTNAAGTSPVWQQIYTVPDNPGHLPGQLFPTGQSYLTNGLEATVWMQLDWVGNGTVLGACADIKAPVSTDNGARWGYPYDHSTLAGGDINSVIHDPLSGRRYAAAGNLISVYDYLGYDDAHTDIPPNPSALAYGVYYQDPGEIIWHPLKTDFGVPAGQSGASPVWLTFDETSRKLYVSIISSDVTKDGIHVFDVLTSTWSELPTPMRDGVEVKHPYNVRILPGGGIVATYCAHQEGDAAISPPTLTNGAYKPTSGVFLLTPGSNAWIDRTKEEMKYFTRDLIVDPHDPSSQTWFACVWNTDSNTVTPANPNATPATWGGLYRTTNAGVDWTRIWAGDSTYPSSATSCTIHPESALKDELLLTTRFGGLWITQNAHADIPVFSRVDSYRFRAPIRAYYDPNDHDKIWVASNGNGLVEGVRPSNFGEWKIRSFGTSSNDDSIAGQNIDADGDGISNLIEYITRSNPLVREPAPLSLQHQASDTLSFRRNHTANDATITLESSDNLQSWQPLASAVGMGTWNITAGCSLQESQDGMVTLGITPGSPVCFYRLHAAIGNSP